MKFVNDCRAYLSQFQYEFDKEVSVINIRKIDWSHNGTKNSLISIIFVSLDTWDSLISKI